MSTPPGTNTLDHNNRSKPLARRSKKILNSHKPLLQFQLGKNPFILSVKVFLGLVFLSASGHNNDTMFHFFGYAVHDEPGFEMSDGAFDHIDFCLGKELDHVVLLHPGQERSEFIMKFCTVDKVMDAPEVPPDILFPFYEIYIKPLIGQLKGGGHSGDTGPYHERRLIDRNR